MHPSPTPAITRWTTQNTCCEKFLTRAIFTRPAILLDTLAAARFPDGGSLPLIPAVPMLETTGEPIPAKPALGRDNPRFIPTSIPPLVLVDSMGSPFEFGRPPSTGTPAAADTACCCARRALRSDSCFVTICSLASSFEKLLIFNLCASLQPTTTPTPDQTPASNMTHLLRTQPPVPRPISTVSCQLIYVRANIHKQHTPPGTPGLESDDAHPPTQAPTISHPHRSVRLPGGRRIHGRRRKGTLSHTVQTVRPWQHQRKPACWRPHPQPSHRSHDWGPQHISLRSLCRVRVRPWIVAPRHPIGQVHRTAIHPKCHSTSEPSSHGRAITPPSNHTTSKTKTTRSTHDALTPAHHTPLRPPSDSLQHTPRPGIPDVTRKGSQANTSNSPCGNATSPNTTVDTESRDLGSTYFEVPLIPVQNWDMMIPCEECEACKTF